MIYGFLCIVGVLREGFSAGQVMNNDYIYELENHRLQKVSGNSMNLIGGRITDGTLGQSQS